MLYIQGKTKLFYEKKGSKKNPILILPGWGETRKTFDFLINSLKDHFTIYIVDYPPFGKSSNIEDEWSIYDYADLIKNFLKEKEIENPIVIAHSFGGRILSILEGKEHLIFRKVVLIDVAGIRRKSIKRFLKEKAYKFLKRILKLFHRKDLLDRLENHFSSDDYKELPTSMKKTFQNITREDLRGYYQRIKSETLILWGEKDSDTPLIDAYYLNRKIKNSGLVIYKNTHHFSYYEKPIETIKILKEFLKKDMDY